MWDCPWLISFWMTLVESHKASGHLSPFSLWLVSFWAFSLQAKCIWVDRIFFTSFWKSKVNIMLAPFCSQLIYPSCQCHKYNLFQLMLLPLQTHWLIITCFWVLNHLCWNTSEVYMLRLLHYEMSSFISEEPITNPILCTKIVFTKGMRLHHTGNPKTIRRSCKKWTNSSLPAPSLCNQFPCKLLCDGSLGNSLVYFLCLDKNNCDSIKDAWF